MEDSLFYAQVVDVKTLNLFASRCRRVECGYEMYKKACNTCSTTHFSTLKPIRYCFLALPLR